VHCRIAIRDFPIVTKVDPRRGHARKGQVAGEIGIQHIASPVDLCFLASKSPKHRRGKVIVMGDGHDWPGLSQEGQSGKRCVATRGIASHGDMRIVTSQVPKPDRKLYGCGHMVGGHMDHCIAQDGLREKERSSENR
jgi:hypothetical protein